MTRYGMVKEYTNDILYHSHAKCANRAMQGNYSITIPDRGLKGVIESIEK